MSFYRVARRVLCILFIPIFNIHVCGHENVPKEGPVVLIANHHSNWDPVLGSIALKRRIDWLAKQELFGKSIIFDFILKKFRAIPVDRQNADLKAVKSCLKTLKRGDILGAFPQGTVVKAFNPNIIKPGLAMIAIHSKAPIVPMHIQSKYRLFRRTNIIIGEPFYPPEEPEGGWDEASYKKFMLESMEKIYSMEYRKDQ